MRRLLLVVPWVVLGVLALTSVASGMAPSDALAGLTLVLNAIVNMTIEGYKAAIDAYGQYLASS